MCSNNRDTRGGGTMIQLGDQANLIDQIKLNTSESLALLVDYKVHRNIIVNLIVLPGDYEL